MELIDNNNKDFETTFWKVIHNKRIIKLIFHFIENIEWVQYTDYNQIHVDNRIKFKNIHSLEWMVINEQYELLKCKLKHCGNLSRMSNKNIHSDFIDITVSGINRLLKLGKNDTNDEKEEEQEEEEDIFMSKEEQLSIERILLSELLVLILDNKKLEIAYMNLPLMAIKNNNSTALHILVNEPYSYQIFPSDLEWAIRNSSPLIVSEIISFSPSPSNSTRNKSIKLASKNDIYRDEILQLILNNPQLYNSPESSSSTLPIKKTTKKFKSENGIPINIVSTNSTTCNSVKKLNIQLLLKIKSVEIQNRLLDLHFVKQAQRDILPQCDKSFKRISDSVNKLLGISGGGDGDGDGSTVDRSKEIHKLLAMESNLYYRSYLSRYDEPINELDLMVVVKHCLSNYSIKSLSFLLSNSKNIGFLNKNKNKFKGMVFYSKKSPTVEFIKLYLSNIQIFNNTNCTESIDNYILNIGSEKEYVSILNEITNSTNNNRYPPKWNSILQSKRNCINKETIDYLVEFKSFQIIQKVIGQLNFKYFESINVIEYAIKSFSDNSIVDSKLNYRDIFKFAINNCDIGTLTSIHSDELVKKIIEDPLSLSNEMTFGIESIENLNKLFNFFKSINFDCFTEKSFIKLLDSVCYPSSTTKGIDEINQLSISPIPFNKFKEGSISELVSSILHFKSNKIQFILNNFNPISIDLSIKSKFKEIWNENINNDVLYTFKRQISFLYDISYTDSIVQSIEIMLNHYEIERSALPNKINIEMYSTIINHLFKCLISSKGVDQLVSILKVFKLVNKINENGTQQQQVITIEHSLYHSFFYICIKSIKFQKYLMELPSITSIMNANENEDRINEYEIDMEVGTFKGYNISKYLDPSIFTFEYLFGSGGEIDGGASFEDVLFKLINHLSLLPATNDRKMTLYEDEDNDYYSKSLNSNLIYLLDINRSDLFFQILDQIQQQLNDKKIKIGKFPTVIKTGNLSNNNKTIIESIGGGSNNGKLYQQTITNGRIFKFSIDLFNLACIVFEGSDLEFQKFISFCGYHSILDCIKDTNNLFINQLYLNHFNQFQTILNIHQDDTTNQLFDNVVVSFKNNQNSYETIVYGSSDGHGGGCEDNGITINHLIKFENHFFSTCNGGENNLIKHDRLIDLLSINNNSIKFNIVLRELFLKSSKNQTIPNYFIISKSTIDDAIKNDQIGYLKYYYKNCTTNNDNSKVKLLQYLKQQLSLNL